MTKFITLLVGCSLAFALSAQAEQDQKKKTQKKPVQQHQQPQHVQQHTNTHVQGQGPKHYPNVNTHTQNPYVNKQHHVPSSIQTNKVPAVQSNKIPGVHTNNPAGVVPNKEVVQRVRSEHVDFHARPNTNITSAQFNQNYRIHGAENWHGAHYEVFRSYHPEWHDHDWWHAHYANVLLIGGGWYFFNAGYWYPAWGYSPAAAYYPYDGPIYVGQTARPADQVVADTQSLLQEQGYYHGEVDGLLGPMTRDALASFQQDHGLVATAAIDEPTLDALGLT